MIRLGKKVMRKIDIARIPELTTSVGIQGSVKQKEVGGPMCLSALLGIGILLMGGR
jgi:hypothetical protein